MVTFQINDDRKEKLGTCCPPVSASGSINE